MRRGSRARTARASRGYPRLCQLRHVPQLRAPRRSFPRGGARRADMMAAVMTGGVRAAGRARPVWDPWLLGCTFVLLAAGVIMVYSASGAHAHRAKKKNAHFLIPPPRHPIPGL